MESKFASMVFLQTSSNSRNSLGAQQSRYIDLLDARLFQTKYDCLLRMGEQEGQILDCWQTDKYCRQISANIDARQAHKYCRQMPTNIVAILHVRQAGCPSPLIESKWPVGDWCGINSWGVCMVKHSFHMSIDSKGISTVEWKCQQQKSRLVPQSSL